MTKTVFEKKNKKKYEKGDGSKEESAMKKAKSFWRKESTHATAPPLTFNFSVGKFKIFWLAKATAEKASFNSNLLI